MGFGECPPAKKPQVSSVSVSRFRNSNVSRKGGKVDVVAGLAFGASTHSVVAIELIKRASGSASFCSGTAEV
jgi:hypothetical protein